VTKVTILLAAYNGARFVADQLGSLARQSHQDWSLLISDDGSSDGTVEIVEAFARKRPEGQVTLLRGPGKGATANFRFLLRRARTLPETAIAFCDQDDVWDADHLERAVARMGTTDAGRPWLGGGRMVLCDAQLRPIGQSPLPAHPPAFGNALVQNILSGNTIVMNEPAARLLAAAEAEAGPILLHDWWAYQIISGAGGEVCFDPKPSVQYRQHDANVVGANHGALSTLQRLRRGLGGERARWYRATVDALAASAHRFTPENQQKLTDFAAALKAGSLPQRLRLLRQSGVYHQGAGAEWAFRVLAVLGRI
jgi:glycosyltransferase involved in cell wall biosynthesis